MKEAPASASSYKVEEIVGEKGKSTKTKHFLVKYTGYEDAWWQPAKNLYCTAKVQEWGALDEATKVEMTARAVVANPEDINLIMDLSLDKQTRVASLIKDICIKIGIKRDRIAAIVASPMCSTFTKLDHVNRELGHNFREAAKPYAPRTLDGTAEVAAKRKVAQDHDNMVEDLLQSILKDRKQGFEFDFCIENPRALLRFRPYTIADAWMGVSSRCKADHCVFDHDYQKPTDLWHRFGTEWQPRGCTGDGKGGYISE